ncbi:uncharacterized protein Smp_203460 [Schistosoma mansoni]|uniref:Ovule protein n=1 Tax=Schistosoma mansoni TaxID=6183 RepID=G4VR52_SCHMA|nr:uncharacterized protein Smp_203460 [Schistosoma mansoni]|eukprot:XP_018654186.1 uncharacterized protein Smp_203460 [Schistosoma mansoni]
MRCIFITVYEQFSITCCISQIINPNKVNHFSCLKPFDVKLYTLKLQACKKLINSIESFWRIKINCT